MPWRVWTICEGCSIHASSTAATSSRPFVRQRLLSRRVSRHHHKALVIAQQLRRATPASAAAVREAALAFWLQHEAAHFRAEEDLLMPTYAKHGDARHPLVAAVLGDHMEIRRRFDALRTNGAVEVISLAELGALLAAHVRLEERELFPLVESAVPLE